jgi:4-diphosphocytidyl-2-C-methyl-D-erythritol kinase
MIVRRRGPDVEVAAPAKLNLFLEVLAKRPDGFHEIETVMTPVTLFDTLTVREKASGPIQLECEQTAEAHGEAPAELKTVPEGSENIVVRALEALRQQAGVSRSARVRLTKRIPLAAGMAGGSTDAAAALAAANVLWNLDWPDARLAETAATLGSDVPFFFARSPALCRGRGERVEPLAGLPPLDFVVVAPPVGLSTAEVYRACRPAATSDAPPREGAPDSAATPSATSLIDAWRRGDKPGVGQALHNRLQDAAERLSPWIERLAREVDRYATLGHRMSGSGTSYFALCRNARQARRIAGELANRRLGRTFSVRTGAA